jgi:hypothetical protein
MAASTVRIRASDGAVRSRSRNHRRISPEPIVLGSRVGYSAKYASRIAAWLSVRWSQSIVAGFGLVIAPTLYRRRSSGPMTGAV